MLTPLFRRAAFGAIASLGLLAGSASALTLNAVGGPLIDNDGVDNGIAIFELIDNNTPQTISSIESVTLTGLTHTYVSDLDVLLVYFPDDVNAQGTGAFLFSGLNNGTDFLSNNLNGNYTFSDDAPTPNTLQAAAQPNSNNATVPSGTYRPSGFYSQGGATAIENLDVELAGLDLSTGSLYIYIEDFEPGDTGALTSATVSLTTTPVVPEPTSLAAIAIGAAAMLRRRRA